MSRAETRSAINKERVIIRRQVNLCTRCGHVGVRPPFRRCKPCRDKVKAWAADARVAAAYDGLCVACKKYHPARGNTTCDVCIALSQVAYYESGVRKWQMKLELAKEVAR